MGTKYYKGRGAQINTPNPFLEKQIIDEHIEGIDEELMPESPKRELFYETPKKLINRVDSPDLPLDFSLNPYQGCEHGCVYCYARNVHNYWGFSAGLDFESKLIVKKDAPGILESEFLKNSWRSAPIVLSGNTDCYQPIEKDLKITRNLLKVFAKYRNPVGLITKNDLITRDIDILQELAANNLVHVFISITTLEEKLRMKMEPRTVRSEKRLRAIEKLSKAGIPVAAMVAPIIPAINDHEIPGILKAVSDHGAWDAAYTVVRLNGAVAEIFKDWLLKNFPDRSAKVWKLIEDMHNGKVNDTQWGRRMKGSGNIALTIEQLFKSSKKQYFKKKPLPNLDLTKFRRGGNYQLF